MKKVIETCIDRVLEFDSGDEAAAYIEGLRNKKKSFNVLWRTKEENGKFLLRIQEQYNTSPMISNRG